MLITIVLVKVQVTIMLSKDPRFYEKWPSNNNLRGVGMSGKDEVICPEHQKNWKLIGIKHQSSLSISTRESKLK